MEILAWLPNIWKATLETLYMVGLAAPIAILLGLPLGVLLVITGQRGLAPSTGLNQALGTVVNMGRSLPFIILLVVVGPLTRALVGTTIGATAAIVPLSLAAIPFFARVAETALQEVDPGLVEAAQAMGCTNAGIVLKVLIPEARPSLTLGCALTVINLVGYSAMAGAIGGGGLGDLAIRYGYQRYETEVMAVTVVLLIGFVQGVQWLGNRWALRLARR